MLLGSVSLQKQVNWEITTKLRKCNKKSQNQLLERTFMEYAHFSPFTNH
jgi:hypothetical protein